MDAYKLYNLKSDDHEKLRDTDRLFNLMRLLKNNFRNATDEAINKHMNTHLDAQGIMNLKEEKRKELKDLIEKLVGTISIKVIHNPNDIYIYSLLLLLKNVIIHGHGYTNIKIHHEHDKLFTLSI